MMTFPGCARALATPLLALCMQSGDAHGAAMPLSLRASVTLDHPVLLLGDLVDAPPETDAAVLALPLGQAPRVGHVLRVRQLDLEAQLRRQGIAAHITWRGAAAALVVTRTQRLAPQLLREAASAHLRQILAEPGDTFEVAVPDMAVEIPQRPYQLRARPVDVHSARVLVWLDIIVDDAVYRSVVLPATVTRTRTAWVARRALAGGSAVERLDFTVSEVDVSGLDALPAVPEALAGARLRGALRAGQVLTAQAVAPAGTVLRGDPVRLTLHAGALAIDAAGVAQASAAPGQMVAVRAASSGEILSGRVNRAGHVVIE
jgi:flagella basal body P-ring formation protein FlgA